MSDRVIPVVHVIDDDASIRESAAFLLESAGFRARTYATCAEYLDSPPTPGPGCIVLDLRLPGMSGLEMQRELIARGERLPIIFITGHGDTATAVRAMKNGAVEFLEKPYAPEALLASVEDAISRDGDSLDRRAERARAAAMVDRLTERERAVLAEVVRGSRSQDIAESLGISRRTVESHRNNIMKKLGTRNVAEVVRLAVLAESAAAEPSPG